MSKRFIHTHCFIAKVEMECPYDPADPDSYTKALQQVADKRKALLAVGCELTRDTGRPVVAKD